MPVGWKPVQDRLRERIAEEEARIEALKQRKVVELPPVAVEEPSVPLWQEQQSIFMPQPQRVSPTLQWTPEDNLPAITMPQIPTIIPEVGKIIPKTEVKPVEQLVTPFWQRALQVFGAPFEWVDENIIEPGLALLGTTAGFVPGVERKSGEDFWEWKKRAWSGWEAPGININVPWRDEPWRVDMKGVMEIAPWLLIPGAGQVGGAGTLGARLLGIGGKRVATGMAGVLGKGEKVGQVIGGMAEIIPGVESLGLPSLLGKVSSIVGRTLGTAVEYSPWGLAEKTAGVAIKGGIRAVGKVSERVSTAVGEKLFGKYVPPPTPPVVAKLSNYFKEAVMPARKAFAKELPGLRVRQEKSVQAVFAKYRRGEISLDNLQIELNKARTGAIKPEFALTPEALAARQERAIAAVEARVVSGEISEAVGKGLITKIRKSPAFTAVPFGEAEVKELNDMIIEGMQSGLMKAESGDAFLELMLSGKLPQPHNIRDWAKVFGMDFAKAVGQLKTPQQASQLVDALNLPRAVLASMDLSATLRQGLILSLLHPRQASVWFGRQVKALLSEKLALQMDDTLKARPLFKQFVADGGYIAPLREALPTKAEELFMSDIARRIPGIRRSERAFITYLNNARLTTYEAAHGAMTAQGALPSQFKILTDFINMASGRGILPKSLEKYSPVLNSVLFSPRLQAATLQLPRQLGRMFLSDNPYMRKEAAKALITFVGGGVGLLSLINATGNKVETDPRSGDFGKIKIGETRLDIWRGYLQYARFAAQMLTGERKSAYGNMNKAERGEIAWRFLQSKSSPAFGLMVDLFRGETYLGEPIFKDTTGFSKAARERILPLALQDVIDAMEQGGINKAWIAAPAFLGVGALTYVNDFVRVKEKIAKEMGFESWDDIDPKTQREIENRNAELQVAEIAFDRQVMGTAWGDWRLAGNAIEEVFRQNVENAVAKYRQDGKGYQFREKISDAWTARRGGYDAREKEVRFEDIVKRLNVQDTAEATVILGPEQTAIKIYNDALHGDDMYDEFDDYRFDEANIRKEQLRQSLGEDMFKYVEDYQSVRYEAFPPEFLELMKAKTILKPYWEIEDRVVKLFSQKFADSPKGQALISKMRKQKRLANPEMERYYQMFYVQ